MSSSLSARSAYLAATARQTFAGDVAFASGRPFYDVTGMGAVGDGSTDDAAAINAAIVTARAAYAAAPEAGMRTVYFPPGRYRCLSTITQRYGVRLEGPASLWFSSDLGAGTFGLTFAAVGGDGYHNAPQIRGLRIYGPATTFTIGTAGASMNGINLSGGESLFDVFVSQFRAGIVLGENHNSLVNVVSIRNHYNVEHPSPHGSADNHQHFGCYYHNASFASVAVGTNNVMSQTIMVGCQLGYSPYGLYKSGSGATNGLAISSTFIDTSFEGCGNAFIYDSRSDGTTDSLTLCTFERCLGLASSGASTYQIAAALPLVAGIDVRGLNACRFTEAYYPLTALIPGGARQINVRSTAASNDIYGGSISTTAGQFVNNVGQLGAFRIHTNANSKAYSAEGHYAWATIAPGDLCAWSSNGNGVVRYGGATGGAFAGVAMNNATVGEIVMLAQPGSLVLVNCASGTAGSNIAPDATTPHHGSSTGTPVVAAGVGALSGGQLLCKLV